MNAAMLLWLRRRRLGERLRPATFDDRHLPLSLAQLLGVILIWKQIYSAV
jgi:hypothetical protein